MIVEGTNLGVTPAHIEHVRINGVVCDVLDELYKPGVRYQLYATCISIPLCQYDVPVSIFSFACVTPKQGSVSGSHLIHVNFTYLDDEIISPTTFEFVVSSFSLSRYLLTIN